ncbi:hypothetical protein LCGC14_1530450 [marine sediment metagenome]|uniref:Uncharacterized protein n=1 Tax=marine sediment metagenome TaxID=412755 RepID=A0A0F9JGU7_9ZZZZ
MKDFRAIDFMVVSLIVVLALINWWPRHPEVIQPALCTLDNHVSIDHVDLYLEALGFEPEELAHAKIMAWGTPTPTPAIPASIINYSPAVGDLILSPPPTNATGTIGDILWNPTTHSLKIRDASEWVTLHVLDKDSDEVELNLTTKWPAGKSIDGPTHQGGSND